MRRYLALAAAAVLSATTMAQGATFTDRADFLAAAGASADHSFPTAVPRGTAAAGFSNGLTVGTLGPEMASSSVFGAVDHGISGALLISGVENLNFFFSETRFGFGLNIFEPTSGGINGCNTATCEESTFTFTFLNGSTVVGTETFSPANDVKTFFGTLLNTGFDKVEMRETIAGSSQVAANDNEFFGGFVSAAAPAPVPLPASVFLLLAGVAGLGALRRKA